MGFPIDTGHSVQTKIRYPYITAELANPDMQPLELGLTPANIHTNNIVVTLHTSATETQVVTDRLEIEPFIYRIPEHELRVAYTDTNNNRYETTLKVHTIGDSETNPQNIWAEFIMPSSDRITWMSEIIGTYIADRFVMYRYDTTLNQRVQIEDIIPPSTMGTGESASGVYWPVYKAEVTGDEYTYTVPIEPRFKSIAFDTNNATEQPPWGRSYAENITSEALLEEINLYGVKADDTNIDLKTQGIITMFNIISREMRTDVCSYFVSINTSIAEPTMWFIDISIMSPE